MNLIKQLRDKAAAKAARMNELMALAVKEDRDLTEAEQTEFNDCETAAEKAASDADRMEKAAKHTAPPAPEATPAIIKDVTAPKTRTAVQVNDDLTGSQIVGIMAWGAVRNKHYPTKTALEHIEDAGFQVLADASRQTTDALRTIKAFQTLTGAGGDNVVDTPLSRDFIETLRNSSAFLSAGPVELDMSFGSIEIPGGLAGATASYNGEGDDAAYTQMTTRKVAMSAKNLAAITAMSNQSIEYSPLAVASLVGDDLNFGMQLAIDNAGLRGTGSGDNPTGIRSLLAVSRVIAAAAPTVAGLPTLVEVETELRRMLTLLRSSNVPMRRPVWIMSSRVFTFLEFLKDGNGNKVYPSLSLAIPTLFKYRVIMSEQVPSNLGTGTDESEIYLQDFGHVLMGVARALRLRTSTEASYLDAGATMRSAFSRDETIIRATAAHDFDMRHTTSGVVLTTVDWGA